MKTKNVLLVSLALSFSVAAQVPTKSPEAPDLLVVSQEWKLYTHNPALDDEDPFRANDDVRQAQRDIKINIQENKIRARAGLPAQPPPVRNRTVNRPVNETKSFYKYEIKIKNTGNKTIRAVVCDYVFFEASTKREIGRIRFAGAEKISPGKTKKLVAWTESPPSQIIGVTQSSDKLREQYSEQVIIQSVEYDDNSIWKLPEK